MSRKIATSKITSKGQVTVPEPIRSALRLREGDQIEWQVDNLTAQVRKRTGRLEDMAAMLSRDGQRPYSVEEMDEAVGQHLARKHGRRR